MNEKFKNRYRIPSARAPWWDDTRSAMYFVTICTAHRECYFGKVEKGKMELSGIGIIADILWHESKNRCKNLELGPFVVMPNHVHGVLKLTGNGDGATDVGTMDDGTTVDVETLHATSLPNNTHTSEISENGHMSEISENGHTSEISENGHTSEISENGHMSEISENAKTSETKYTAENGKNDFNAKISPKSGSVSTIIRSYKSAVTKHAHRLGFDFAWQTRFYDHLIRNERSFQNISEYLINNPVNWDKDSFKPKQAK
jgi:putative transposase